MTREAKVGLLLGLAFIVAFGMILSEIQGVDDTPIQPEAAAIVETNYYQPNPLPQEDLAMGPVKFRTVEPRYAKREPAGRNAGVASAAPTKLQRLGGFTFATILHQPTETKPTATQSPGPKVASLDTIPVGQPALPPRESGTVQPAPPRQRTYRVKANDNLHKIARVVYGQRNGHLFNKIYEANRDRLDDASSIRVGQVLVIPPHGAAGAAVAGRPAVRELDLVGIARHVSTPRRQIRRRVYVVQPGDNLTAIARKVYNDTSSQTIEKIFQANRDKLRNKNNLPKGVKLRIPG